MRREKEALLGFTFTRESEPGLVARDSISFRQSSLCLEDKESIKQRQADQASSDSANNLNNLSNDQVNMLPKWADVLRRGRKKASRVQTLMTKGPDGKSSQFMVKNEPSRNPTSIKVALIAKRKNLLGDKETTTSVELSPTGSPRGIRGKN